MGVIVPGLFIVSIMTFSFIFKKYEWIGNANITSAIALILSAIVLNFLNDILANYKSKDSSKNYIKYNTYFGISFKIWGIIFCIFSIIYMAYRIVLVTEDFNFTGIIKSIKSIGKYIFFSIIDASP